MQRTYLQLFFPRLNVLGSCVLLLVLRHFGLGPTLVIVDLLLVVAVQENGVNGIGAAIVIPVAVVVAAKATVAAAAAVVVLSVGCSALQS